jgi:hypothetical protein
MIKEVLKEDFDYTYRKIKRVSFQGNSQRCLVQRLEYAKRMLDLYQADKIVVNCDESWVGESDFRRMKWGPRHGTNSVRERVIAPRVTLIMAHDSNGELFMSFSQSNTDGPFFQLFLKHLVELFDAQRPSWRETHVILLDGANYHNQDDTLDQIVRLKIPVIFSGPYSYDAAACELAFGYLKSQDINQRGLSTGKKVRWTSFLMFSFSPS